MQPKTLDGNLFKKIVINGTINLKNNYIKINELNVFPVPDGDTGSNMQSTMLSGVNDIMPLENEKLSKVSKTLSRGLLMGARGNSGVILSQLFSGLGKGFKGLEVANAVDVAKAFKSATEQAYSAVINPVEGTILTVAREAADVAMEEATLDMTILEIFEVYIKEAYESLQRTPDLLPVLKEAGVVDSGAVGYITIVEGMVSALKGEMLDDSGIHTVKSVSSELVNYSDDVDFGYCTEFIVQLKNHEQFDQKKFTQNISKLGDSLVVVHDENILKVHIHTKTPGDALNFGQQFGSFANLKIENMSIQHTEAVLHTHEDNDCDCGHDHHDNMFKSDVTKKYGIITVVNGKGLKETFIEMGCDYVIEGGQTMNPATEDFIKAVECVNAENIIIIPNNSNVMLSAQTASKLIEDKNVVVLPAKTIPQGYTSLTMFDTNQELEENLHEMEELIKHVKSGEVTYAVRDTEYNGIRIKKDDFIGIYNGEITISSTERQKTTLSLIDDMVDSESEIVTIIFGSSVVEDELNSIVASIEDMHSSVEVETISGEQEIYSYIICVE